MCFVFWYGLELRVCFCICGGCFVCSDIGIYVLVDLFTSTFEMHAILLVVLIRGANDFVFWVLGIHVLLLLFVVCLLCM